VCVCVYTPLIRQPSLLDLAELPDVRLMCCRHRSPTPTNRHAPANPSRCLPFKQTPLASPRSPKHKLSCCSFFTLKARYRPTISVCIRSDPDSHSQEPSDVGLELVPDNGIALAWVALAVQMMRSSSYDDAPGKGLRINRLASR
jgi:hypothetical protein